MNKFILAFVGAAALSLTAHAIIGGADGPLASTPAGNAEGWFDGGIKAGWPETATGGGWDKTNGTTYAEGKLTVSAAAESPLTFTAAVEKVTADYTAKISSTVGFTAFEELPDVPAEAKAGVIVYGGKYYAISKTGWTDTGIEVSEAEVAVDVTFLDSTNVVYTIGGTSVTNEIAEATSISKVCTSGDGTLANLKATVEAKIQPIEPSKEGKIDCKTEEQATALADAITTNPETFIKAPEDLTGEAEKTAYKKMFKGRADGTTVYIEFTDVAKGDIQKDVDDNTVTESVAAALIEPTETSVTIDAKILGIFYWIEGAEGVQFGTKAQGPAAMATGGGLELVKPEKVGTGAQQFYKVSAGAQDPAK